MDYPVMTKQKRLTLIEKFIDLCKTEEEEWILTHTAGRNAVDDFISSKYRKSKYRFIFRFDGRKMIGYILLILKGDMEERHFIYSAYVREGYRYKGNLREMMKQLANLPLYLEYKTKPYPSEVVWKKFGFYLEDTHSSGSYEIYYNNYAPS